MGTVPLGEDLGIETCSDLKLKLAPLLAEDGELVLDAGEVRRIHTASVQVLCAFVRTRREAGRAVRIAPCTETLLEAARLLGVSDVLDLPASNDNLKTVENAA